MVVFTVFLLPNYLKFYIIMRYAFNSFIILIHQTNWKSLILELIAYRFTEVLGYHQKSIPCYLNESRQIDDLSKDKGLFKTAYLTL